jgi:hypothetical protein
MPIELCFLDSPVNGPPLLQISCWQIKKRRRVNILNKLIDERRGIIFLTGAVELFFR